MTNAWRRFVDGTTYKYLVLVVCVGVVVSILLSPDRHRDLDMVRWFALLVFVGVAAAFAIRDMRRKG
jgi:hypothetical protein